MIRQASWLIKAPADLLMDTLPMIRIMERLLNPLLTAASLSMS